MTVLEKASFEEYYSKYYQQVYKYILKKVLSIPVAEDLTMEAFLSCYKNFEQFNPDKASFATWLYVVVNNKLKNYYRDHKIHENSDDCNALIESFEDEFIASTYISEMRQELCNALKILSETQRSISFFIIRILMKLLNWWA